ncbi:PEGA domain-containing protein [candidate division KSB1 bacterium]|nr:MAG: PEGA domain-containing protein [candidate division KSB1 bacterium]
MRSKRKRKSSRRSTIAALNVFLAVLRFGAPLVIIAAVAFWLILYRQAPTGSLCVTSSVRGAEILVDGVQTGYVTDTTIVIPLGRRIITVRKNGFVSDPEFGVAEIRSDVTGRLSFDLRTVVLNVKTDSIPPLPKRLAEKTGTGEPYHVISPGAPRPERRFVDFAEDVPRTSYSAKSPVRTETADSMSLAAIRLEPPVSIGIQGTQVTVTSVVDGAEIHVNGAPTPRITPYTFKGLDRGFYTFRVKKEGFTSQPDSVSVSLDHDFQSELISFEVQPDSTIPQPSLTISTTPLAAAFRLNGKPAGVGKTTVDPGFGAHRIEFAEAPGYKTPAPVSVTLTADAPQSDITGIYERLTGDAFVAVRSGEEGSNLDGGMLRVFVDNELILDGAKQRFDAALIGKVLSGKRLVRIQYGDLVSEIHVNTVNGYVSEITLRQETFFSKRKLRLREKSSIPLEQWEEKTGKMIVLRAN